MEFIMRGGSWALLGALVGCRTAGKDVEVSADTGAIGVVDVGSPMKLLA